MKEGKGQPNAAEGGESTPLHGTYAGEDPAARRLQRMGSVTVGVSLPRAWVGERGLSVGSSVTLRALPDGSLLLRDRAPPEEPPRVRVVVTRGAPPEHIFRELVAGYVSGASEFELVESGGLSPETRQMASVFSRRTVEPEIVLEGRERLVLRDVSAGSGIDVGPILRRMFALALEMQREAGRTWVEVDALSPSSLASRDDEVDRYAWLVERTLALRSVPGAPGVGESAIAAPFQALLLARYIERVADHAVHASENGPRLIDSRCPSRILESLTGLHRQVIEVLAQAFAVADLPDLRRANEVIDCTEALHATHDGLRESLFARSNAGPLSPASALSLAAVLESIDRTIAYAQDIAQVGLDRAALRPRPARARALAPSISSETKPRGGIRTV
ncbi:MAG: hypothetical protein L3K09_08175 [Thermoplasmata archaeon]|nr:hypothetical protein [Thermoplasmata archaeon]